MITEYKVIEKNWPIDDNSPILPGEMHVYSNNGVIKAVNFICPCGCGHECYTPVTTDKKIDHHWLYSKGPTISPSIRFLGGCKAHFTITDGKAEIHADSGK